MSNDAEALLRAVEAGDADALHRQLDDGLKRAVNSPLRGGVYAVHVAAQRGDARTLEALLLAGGNVNQESEEVGTHLGWTAVHYAAHRNDATLLRVLVSCKADLRRRAADGWCALHVAAFKGGLAAMRVLLECGADVNCTTNLGQTPLVFAVNYGRLDCVRALLKGGADVTVRDVQGDTLLHHAFHYQLSKLFESAYEVPEGQLDVAVALVLAGAPAAEHNADDRLPTHFLRNVMPSLQSALELLAAQASKLTAASTVAAAATTTTTAAGAVTTTTASTTRELNYLTLCTMSVDALVALGVPASAATQLHATLQQVDLERVAAAAVREHKSGGSDGKKQAMDVATAATAEDNSKTTTTAAANTATAAANDDDTTAAAAAADATTTAPSVALPSGHPSLSADEALRALRSADDPSGGKCPFFQRRAHKQAAPTSGQRTPSLALQQQQQQQQHMPHGVVADSSSNNDAADKPLCPFSIAYVQRHRTTLLCMGIAFVLGMWTDQLIARLAGLH